MANKPNKLGRIEGEPKVNKFKKFPWKVMGIVISIIVLINVGIFGTLKYQSFIANTEQKGADKYIAQSCERFKDEAKKTTWLECEEVQ